MTFDGTIGDGALEGALSFSRNETAFAYIHSSLASPPEVMVARESGQTVQNHAPERHLKTALGAKPGRSAGSRTGSMFRAGSSTPSTTTP